MLTEMGAKHVDTKGKTVWVLARRSTKRHFRTRRHNHNIDVTLPREKHNANQRKE